MTKLYFQGVFLATLMLESACASDPVASIEPIVFEAVPTQQMEYRPEAGRAFGGHLPVQSIGSLAIGSESSEMRHVGQVHGWDINRDGVIDFYQLFDADGQVVVKVMDFDGDGSVDCCVSE